MLLILREIKCQHRQNLAHTLIHIHICYSTQIHKKKSQNLVVAAVGEPACRRGQAPPRARPPAAGAGFPPRAHPSARPGRFPRLPAAGGVWPPRACLDLVAERRKVRIRLKREEEERRK
ncbi:unnamed protein product [Urochloa humidicola]